MIDCNYLRSKYLYQLTGSEFLDLQKCDECEQNTLKLSVPAPTEERYVYGIPGIAKLFNCSKSTASRIKKSGKIDAAIMQNGGGRIIVVDAELALKLFREKKKGGRR
jgi:hypothetical protein